MSGWATLHSVLPVLDRTRRVQVTSAVVGLTLSVVYAASLTLPESPTLTLARIPIYLGVYLATLVAMAAEWRRSSGSQADTWLAVIVAMVIAIAGTAYYEVEVRPLPTRPYPALSDYGRFLIDVLVYSAVLAQIKVRVRTWHPSVWLDGVIVTATATAVGVQFWLSPLLQLNEGNLAATVVSFIYILGDLLLMGMMLGGWAMLGRNVDLQWIAFSLAMCAITIGDAVLFTQQALNGAASYRAVLDLGMMGAANLLAWAVCLPDAVRRSARVQSRSGYGVLVAPGLSALIALTLTTPLAGWEPTRFTQSMAAVALLSVGARSALTFREVRILADARVQVRTDPLTGLLNRRGFAEDVQRVLGGHAGPATPGSLLLLDIRMFKEINDSLGHHAGDKLLIAFAQRLRQLVPAASSGGTNSLVARLSGNEFAALLTHGSSETPVRARTCEEIVQALTAEPFEVDGIQLHLTIGASIARAPEHGDDFAQLIRAADLAMTHSKSSRALAEFHPDMAHGFEQSHMIQVNELRRALESQEIVVFYQPKVRLSDELPLGVEALVRWQHPRDGLIFPDQFLPLAEQAGLMPRLTEVVMQIAIHDVASWHRAGKPVSLSINLPAAAILDANLPGRVKTLLADAQLASSALTVEITEETLLGDRVRARDVLAELRRAGVSVSIDDYGTGYSSLAYLRELPVDELKLDKSFIFPMSSDPRAAAIVRSTIDLAHSLGLGIVAEGVEDQATARQLAAYDCDTAQGYHFSRPVPAPVLLQWLDDFAASPVPSQRA